MHELGKLIVFEGPDGVGKTELALRCSDYLKATGIRCDYASFPGNAPGTLGRQVYQLHHNHAALGIASLDPTSRQLLHIAAHIDSIESKILPALRTGRWVVLDRFWWSTWAYGVIEGADRESLQLMIDLERIHWRSVRPVVVFLVRRRTPLGECSRSPWNRLVEEYTALATREGTTQAVSCIDNDGRIAEALTQVVAFPGLIPPPANRRRRRHARVPPRELPFDLCQSVGSPPIVLSRMAPAKPTVVFDTYWRFAAERQAIFFRRLFGRPPPWTKDAILREYKFTNAYRASDRTSQYLIRNVIYSGDQSPEEVFFRTILFKFFNRIETWELLAQHLGVVTWSSYSFERYDAILNEATSRGTPIYSAAYMMPSGDTSLGSGRKHCMHLRLLERMMKDKLPIRLAEIPSMAKAFDLLRSYPTIGDFLAYQYVTDLNYSTLTNFSEMEFVVPGPGARNGIRKCFTDLGGLTEAEIIKVVAERQQAEFERRDLTFRSLCGRPLQLIDCQSLFCEVDKYARIKHPEFSGVIHRTRIKHRFRLNPKPLAYWYPPKWGVNERMTCGGDDVASV